jgi:predicted nucleotidyltransferase
MPSLDTRRQQAVADFADRLRTALGPRLSELRLFGSVARGDAQLDSDIDILVVVRASAEERGRMEREVVDIAFDVNLQHEVYVSPRVLTAHMLADPVWGQTPFLKTVRRESVAL